MLRSMKKILANMIAPAFLLGLILACDDEEITSSFDTLDIAPTVDAISPDGPVKVGEGFDISINLSDGESSPLSSVTVILLDGTDTTEISRMTLTASGTSDSVVWAMADNGSADLDTGAYILRAVATDVAGLSNDPPFDQAFTVFDLPFNANITQLWILGSFNGWGGAADGSDRADWKFELTGDNIWQLDTLKNVLLGDAFKLSTSPDFADGFDSYSDPDCDGVMEVFNGPGNDTGCEFKGDFSVTFNDQTLEYTFSPIIALEQNLRSLYMAGSFNNFQGSDDYQFRLDSNNTWIIDEALIGPGDQFLFVEEANLVNGEIYGDNEPDSIADAGGTTITMPSSISEAFYKVSFNDATRAYQFDFIKFPSISVIGSATGDDTWTIDTNLRDFGDGTFRHAMAFYEGAFKFRANADWGTNWGGVDFPAGGTMSLNGADISVDAASSDVYIVNFTPESGAVAFGATDIAIIGAATGDDTWSTDITMTQSMTDPAIWSITMDLVAGDFKVRTDELWDYNWGPDGYNTPANFNVATDGNYTVEININTGDYTITPN